MPLPSESFHAGERIGAGKLNRALSRLGEGNVVSSDGSILIDRTPVGTDLRLGPLFIPPARGVTRAKLSTASTLNGFTLPGGCYAAFKVTGSHTLDQATLTQATLAGTLPGESIEATADLLVINDAERNTALRSLAHADNPSLWVSGFLDGSIDLNGTTYPILRIDAARGWAC
jgi:hypothetical protein